MTGSLQNKGGVYYAVLNLKDEQGRRRPKWICTQLEVKNNKRRAEEFLKKLLVEYEGVKVTYSKDTLFSDYMYEWLETIAGSIEQNTYESYKDIITRYIKPYFSARRIKLQNLEPQHIQAFYNGQIKNGLSANTVLKQHANIRKALQHAVKMNIIIYNPADRVTLPKKQKYIANFLNEKQINELLALFKNEQMYVVVLLAAFYGLRRSEVLGLKWNTVDFENNTITIKDTVVEYDTVIDKERTKTKASYRTLPLPDEIKAYLQQLRNRQLENRLFLGSGYIQNDYVCKRDNGEPFRPNYVTERFYRVARRSELPRIRFHDLRHSSASLLLASGFSLKEIQEFLGHGDLGTTANIYAHLQFEAKKDMAASMQSKLQFAVC